MSSATPAKIRLLPDSVANQIAAGEVIQRPASVIKELVENAVDAGADDIRIYVRDAGRTLIQVIDNGSGMSATDTRMAFERHATSKISSAADLSSLRTMGFRGEALPSICAISQVEVRSRIASEAMGTRLVISGSRVESQEPDVCEAGTNIMVKNLFFNVPARRKFLKSDSVELSNIMREFERLALVNPSVRMSLDTGTRVISLGKGTLLRRIDDIWKGSLASQLIPVEAETPSVRISGFVTRPEFARRRNALQYFLVNGRNMRHPYFRKAVINCFSGLITPESQPCFFIKFDIDPAAIDVNIHPTKDEIKFEEETIIWSVLTAAVKASLGKNSAVPSIDFDSDTLPVTPPTTTPTPQHPDTPTPTPLPTYDIPEDYNPFLPTPDPDPDPKGPTPPLRGGAGGGDNWDHLTTLFLHSPSPKPSSDPEGPTTPTPQHPNTLTPQHPNSPNSLTPQYPNTPTPLPPLSFASKYLVTVLEPRGIVIVDQHRAHVKVLYERLLRRLESDVSATQTLLFPILLELAPEQEVLLEECRDTLTRLGLVIEREADRYVITGTPPDSTSDDAVSVVQRVLETMADEASHYGEENLSTLADARRRSIALSMARGMAVRRGRELTPEERTTLLTDLFALPDPSLTPTGRRIYTLLDPTSLTRLLP